MSDIAKCVLFFTSGLLVGRFLLNKEDGNNVSYSKNGEHTLVKSRNVELKIKNLRIDGSFDFWSDDISTICDRKNDVTYVTGLPVCPEDIGLDSVTLYSLSYPNDGSEKKSKTFSGKEIINLDFCKEIRESVFYD